MDTIKILTCSIKLCIPNNPNIFLPQSIEIRQPIALHINITEIKYFLY